MSAPPAPGRRRDRTAAVLGAVAALAVAGAALLAGWGSRGLGSGDDGSRNAAPARAAVPAAASAPASAPAGPRNAAPQDAAASDPLFVAFEGDAQAGQRVVMGASGAGITSACFQCHGLQGQGDGGAAFPRLAGQPAWYLYKQLNDYAEGTRPHEVMTPIARALSVAQRRDVAAYYAAARPEAGDPPPAPLMVGQQPELLQLGGMLSAIGSPQRGVQSCVGCHGPAGSGLPPETPYLAGLSPHYLELQLRLWAEGTRRNDPQGVMADVARRLTPQERRAVALYFGALPPPGP